jgi:oligopeptidase A
MRMAKNSLLGYIDELRFGTYQPEDAQAALTQTEKLAWERLNAILQMHTSERTFENTVLALTRSTDEFHSAARLIGHLESVLGEAWGDASNLATERAARLANDIAFHKGLYQALTDFGDSKPKLSQARQRLLDELLRDYEHNGVNLPDDTVARLREVRMRLGAATNEFAQNVVKANDSSGIEVRAEDELAGLDATFIENCRKAAQERGKTGFWVAYNQPAYVKLMVDCQVRATRQAFYHLAVTRANRFNEDLARTILSLRREQARLLGYANFADYALAERMARTGTAAWNFVASLTRRYQRLAEAERDELQAFARQWEHDDTLVLDASDLDTGLDYYFASRYRAEQFGIDEHELRAYFQEDVVIGEMFATLNTLYGVTFQRVALPGWHDDVETYEIHDQHGHHLATVWCDWYARKGKGPGAWMNRYYIADRDYGNYGSPHLGYVCANLEQPTDGMPSLLTLDDVETIWHEFGHFMHLALNKTELREQSMIGCKLDFVEAPSQIMQNWVWQPDILRRFAKHYKTDQPLPDDLINKLIANRNFRVGSKAMRQLFYATVDLALHIDYDPDGSVGVSDFARAVKADLLPAPVDPEDGDANTFTHVFAGGYAAGYYSYKWAEAIEADLFTRFATEGILSGEVGRAYRDQVLTRGNEVDPEVLIEDFLGRPTNQDAMLRRDGVI